MKGFTILSLSHVQIPRNSFPRAEAGMYQLDEKTLVALQDWAFACFFRVRRPCGDDSRINDEKPLAFQKRAYNITY